MPRPFIGFCLVLIISVGCFAQPLLGGVGRLRVEVVERGSRRPVPCRGWVDSYGKRLFEPESTGSLPYKKDRSFACAGTFQMEVPVGAVTIHVERGKEYVPVDRIVDVKEGENQVVRIELHRWTDMAKRGWFSADLHVHFSNDDIAGLKLLSQADDVNFLPSFSYWNRFEKQWPDFGGTPNVFADPNHLVTRRNEEIERIGGDPFHSVDALFIFGLEKPIYVPRHTKTFPASAVLARAAKKTSPNCIIDTDKPLWAENVVTMGLGLFDSVQVVHNHYHREVTLGDGGLCCGMAGTWLERPSIDFGRDELFHRTNGIYYRWLNCGFRLAASGGSAMGVMKVPLGYCRTYAYLDGALNERSYLDALKAGRTFATSGPMLFLQADGQMVGATLKFQSAVNETIKLKSNLESIEKIDALELVYNGQVIQRRDLTKVSATPSMNESIEYELKPVRSGWVIARAIYRNIYDNHLRQAHTSPIYIEVDGKPTANRQDAEYMIRWIDELLKVSQMADRYGSDKERVQSQRIFYEAREVYERIGKTALQVWGD